jgi:hypothetical protein
MFRDPRALTDEELEGEFKKLAAIHKTVSAWNGTNSPPGHTKLPADNLLIDGKLGPLLVAMLDRNARFVTHGATSSPELDQDVATYLAFFQKSRRSKDEAVCWQLSIAGDKLMDKLCRANVEFFSPTANHRGNTRSRATASFPPAP